MNINKTFRLFGFDIRLMFTNRIIFRKVVRLTFDLPDCADGVILHETLDGGLLSIKYYNRCKVQYIELPKCTDADIVHLVPRTEIVNKTKINTTNRYITVDVYK